MEIIIEEISRGHKLLGRQKFASPEITIGRGYGNDIIVADPHVCPEHLKISWQDGVWVIEDLNSLNGSFIEHSKQEADRHIVSSGDVICFGKSQIRLIFPNHPVAASVPFSAFENVINIARHPMSLVLSVLAFMLVSGWVFYLNKPVEVGISQILVPAIGMTLMFALWPSLVSLISHLTKHDARVMHQFGICFLFFNLLWLSDAIETLVDFNTSSNFPLGWLITIVPVGLAFIMFWLNCYVGFHMAAKKRILAAACLTTLLFGGSALIEISKQPEFNPRPQYSAVLMMPSFVWATSSSVDSFVDDADDLFIKVQKDAQKTKKED